MNNIATADSLCLILHIPWSNPAAAWSEGCLTLNCGCMWNVGLEKGLGLLLRNFRTSILFVCFPMYGEVLRADRIPWEASEKDLRLLSV